MKHPPAATTCKHAKARARRKATERLIAQTAAAVTVGSIIDLVLVNIGGEDLPPESQAIIFAALGRELLASGGSQFPEFDSPVVVVHHVQQFLRWRNTVAGALQSDAAESGDQPCRF